MSLSQYLLEFSICLALFYALYHFLLRRETFFQLNRWYLLLSPALSMIIPFWDWQLNIGPDQSAMDRIILPLVYDLQQPQEVMWQSLEGAPAEAWNFTYLDLLLMVYAVGVLWMGWRLLYRTYRLMQLIGRGKKETKSGYTVITSFDNLPAASFLSYVFWSDAPLSPERKSILEHELVHVRQWHSMDVLLMEIWVMFKWFHPFIYWYRNSMRLTHEYIADAYVSQQSGSRLEYARLLTDTKTIAVNNRLLHQFNSSIKMRLLMLAQKQSSTWKYLRYLMAVPVTALLMLLFSFNLAEDLPDPFTEPFTKAGTVIDETVNQALISGLEPSLETTTESPFLLKWGDLECACKSEQYPNFYQCKDQSLRSRELRRLIRREGGFQLLKEGEAQEILELTAVSKYMKDMGGFQGQFDEMGSNFNADSPLWKQVEKGDVFRFTFTNGLGDHFEFEVVVNNAQEVYPFGAMIEIGDRQYSLSNFNSHMGMNSNSAVVHMDVEELKNLTHHPLKIRKDENTYYKIDYCQIGNPGALRSESFRDIHSVEVNLSQADAILDAFPGDRIQMYFGAEGERVNFAIELRENSAWDGRERTVRTEWGDRTLERRQSVILSKEELEELATEDMYLFINGERYALRPQVAFRGFQVNIAKESTPLNSSAFKNLLKGAQTGDWFHIGGEVANAEFQAPGFRVYVDQDWKKIFAGDPDVSFSEDHRQIFIENAGPEDLLKVLDLEWNLLGAYEFEIDGRYYGPGVPPNRDVLREIATKEGIPKKKLVISRRSCMNCPDK